MNKKDLINAVAKDANLTKTEAINAVESVFENIKEALKKGESFSFPSFGKLTIKERKARVARNPKTGDSVTVAASRGVSFKPSENLKDELN